MVDIANFWDDLDPDIWDWYAILNEHGRILHKSEKCELTAEDGENLMQVWLKSHGGRVEVNDIGYSVLRSEPEQLAARNVKGHGGLVGAITGEKKYAVAHIVPQCTTPLGSAAMMFGDLAWKVSGCEDPDDEE